ncbi:diguanylate cyclase (GGDEF) domain-containing protein [Sulfobacillus thermosulfidooxidans DSM 9293]|uniref:Diguanylate cyclase (GGDEF) domain-containing protein n=1 Tax=Sulfobacillus thermosulfidooxidans (strain DSM 9293 / VKM B-1269 / AT-1) TaxID=929705 RepID=A0A1W1WAJ2_SULTA|nr:GGDEF domain-containing protein [Sulfobacillus thermosulfidooxidans]SMC03265.1 diguanylate cyclase (GGDEF) domain-containing protein [Sulfobacillus thermosulfidooxidans DSM 9293]
MIEDERIRLLMAQGMPVEDMAVMLGMPRGEIDRQVRLAFSELLNRYGKIAVSGEHMARLASDWDLLTGSLTRYAGEQALAKLIQDVTDSHPLTVAFLDVDNLKMVNDHFGHQAGDRLLCRIVHTIFSQIRRSDLVIRWAGDEFVLVLPGASPAAAEELIGRIKRADPEIQFSIGLALYKPGEEVMTLIDRADQAMYQQKRAKKAIHGLPETKRLGIEIDRRHDLRYDQRTPSTSTFRVGAEDN